MQELGRKRGGGRIFEGGILAGHYGTTYLPLHLQDYHAPAFPSDGVTFVLRISVCAYLPAGSTPLVLLLQSIAGTTLPRVGVCEE